MMDKLVVKEQFNKQAVNFNNWAVTQDEKIHQSLYNFFGLEPDEHLLDVACGTGAFSVYAAQKSRAVQGVDISEKMIEIAVENAKGKNLKNARFLCCNVEKLPFESNSFDCVISKAAFHHMNNYQAVFAEMVRCCKKQGRVCIHDIVLYDLALLDNFFEELECEIDISHNLTLSKEEIIKLYQEKGLKILRLFESTPELNFIDYLNHAIQSGQAKEKINELVNSGLKKAEIAHWLLMKNGKLFWKRKVLTIVGQKQDKNMRSE